MTAIPSRLQDADIRFVLLGYRGEKRKRPFEKEWQKTANYRYDDPRLLDHLKRANYGVCGGYADLHILDCDDLTRWNELGTLALIPETFTVESRPGHRQFYLKCKEHFHSGGLFDPEKTEINEDGKAEHVHVGDIKAGAKDGICGGQAVGPSSRHPSGSVYTVVKDLPIAEVSSELLRSIISRFKSSEKVDTGYQRAEEDVRKAKRVKYTAGGPLAGLRVADIMPPNGNVSQSGDELRGDHPVHGSRNGGNYVINVQKNLWHCKRCESGGDVALAIAVKHGLISCSAAGPKTLDAKLYKEVLKIAKREYLGGDPGRAGDECEEEEPEISEEDLEASRTLLADLKDKLKEDPGAPYEPETFKALTIIHQRDPATWERTKRIIKAAGVGIRDLERKISQEINAGNEEKHCAAIQEIGSRIPTWIEEHHFKTTEDTERLYHYEHGVYLDNGETVLKALVESEFPDLTTDTLIRDIIGKVKRRTYIKRDLFNNGHVLNVKNGLIDLDTLGLKPHSPDYLSTAQINVLYNPAAKAPQIQKFLPEVAQSKDIDLIKEIIGWLLWPDYNIHKALMLLGQGRNGKGTLLRLITAFLGKVNVSNVSLQELVADRFAKADLYGKLSNIGGDLPSKDLSDTASFRMLTGEDDNRAQEKYRQAFSFKNKAKLLFSANILPRSPDDTYAFYSRWIILEFLNRFDVQKGTGDPDLLAKLTTAGELSGLLNIALAGLARLRANGWRFSYDKTVEDVEIMYKRNANPVYAFLLDECEPGEAADYIEKTLFYNLFKDYAQEQGIRPLSSKKFSELLKDQTEIPVSTFRPYIEHGDRPWCWQGVKLSTKGKSRLSRVQPTPSLGGENKLKKEGENKEGEKVGITGTLDDLDGEKNPPFSEDYLEAILQQPAGFTAEEHSRLVRTMDRLLKKKWPLMVQSNYGASLVSESSLPAERVRCWLESVGCTSKTLEKSGLEIWNPPTRTKEVEA